MLSLVSLAGMTLDKCAVLRIGTLTGAPLCRENHPMCRLKNPTVAFILQNRCVQCTPAHYPRKILRIGTFTRGSLCRESHTLCRLKNPTVVYMVTCRLSFCKTGVYNVRLFIIIERGRSSMYRKKERLDKSYAKEPLLAFLKAILVFITERVSCIHVWRTPFSVVPIHRTVHHKNESWTDGNSLSRKIQMCFCVKCTQVSGKFSFMLSISNTYSYFI